MKTLEELNCEMYYKYNAVFKAWNGCLYKDDGTAFVDARGKKLTGEDKEYLSCIKVFVRNTKEECEAIACEWANNNKRSLRNVKPWRVIKKDNK